MAGSSMFTGGGGLSGGDAGPSQSGSARSGSSGDLALGGINIGPQGGVSQMQILTYAGLAIAAFIVWKKFK